MNQPVELSTVLIVELWGLFVTLTVIASIGIYESREEIRRLFGWQLKDQKQKRLFSRWLRSKGRKVILSSNLLAFAIYYGLSLLEYVHSWAIRGYMKMFVPLTAIIAIYYVISLATPNG